MKRKTVQIIVYGTLMTGERNHRFCRNAVSIRSCTITGTIYDTGWGFPAFTIPELNSIFTMIADLPNRPRFMPKLYPMRYWVNLPALYQGIRLNEICQLYLDDIVMEEGLPCIRIRPDKERKQKVKNNPASGPSRSTAPVLAPPRA